MAIEWTATGQRLDEGIGISLISVMLFTTYFLLFFCLFSISCSERVSDQIFGSV
jgi:hypothetical protein